MYVNLPDLIFVVQIHNFDIFLELLAIFQQHFYKFQFSNRL